MKQKGEVNNCYHCVLRGSLEKILY